MQKFCDEVRSADWSYVNELDDPNTAYSFIETYKNLYNSCFPVKKANNKRKNNWKPWMSNSILKSIKTKQALYRKYLRDPNDLTSAKYKAYKNKLTHTLRIAKRLYCEKKLTEQKQNIKGTWRILNEVINRPNRNQRLPSTFKSGGNEITNPTEIADKFCSYFGHDSVVEKA